MKPHQPTLQSKPSHHGQGISKGRQLLSVSSELPEKGGTLDLSPLQSPTAMKSPSGMRSPSLSTSLTVGHGRSKLLLCLDNEDASEEDGAEETSFASMFLEESQFESPPKTTENARPKTPTKEKIKKRFVHLKKVMPQYKIDKELRKTIVNTMVDLHYWSEPSDDEHEDLHDEIASPMRRPNSKGEKTVVPAADEVRTAEIAQPLLQPKKGIENEKPNQPPTELNRSVNLNQPGEKERQKQSIEKEKPRRQSTQSDSSRTSQQQQTEKAVLKQTKAKDTPVELVENGRPKQLTEKEILLKQLIELDGGKMISMHKETASAQLTQPTTIATTTTENKGTEVVPIALIRKKSVRIFHPPEPARPSDSPVQKKVTFGSNRKTLVDLSRPTNVTPRVTLVKPKQIQISEHTQIKVSKTDKVSHDERKSIREHIVQKAVGIFIKLEHDQLHSKDANYQNLEKENNEKHNHLVKRMAFGIVEKALKRMKQQTYEKYAFFPCFLVYFCFFSSLLQFLFFFSLDWKRRKNALS
jgi:hypothetical protein